jgi:hypothetical protein
MAHEKKLNDGKRKKEPQKSLKEKRLEKKAKHEELKHGRKSRTSLLSN